MNWRYLIGTGINLMAHQILSSPAFPLTRYVKKGSSWMYDVQVAADTRHFNVIFDVGANIGQTAWGLVRYFPGAAIYCFEPVAESYLKLQANYGRYPNVRLIKCALGSVAEDRDIRLSADPEQNTLVAGGSRNAPMTDKVERVSIVTLDQFCKANGITSIDILKLDVQGWELEVLKDMKIPVRFVYAEVGFRSGAQDMQDFSSFHSRMEDLGFLFGGLYEQLRYGPRKEFVLFGNALYLQPDFMQKRP